MPLAATLDVEKMLWVPGEKKIFIPNQSILDNLDWKTISLYGIPYHYYSVDACDSWLGFSRQPRA
jgi:hypothetical protein